MFNYLDYEASGTFGKGKTIYHIDRVLRETGDVVDNGFYEIYANTEIDDKSDIAELMKIYSSPDLPENNKFPQTCAGIKNLKVGKGGASMSAIVEEYALSFAEEYAEERVEKRDSYTVNKTWQVDSRGDCCQHTIIVG